MADPSTNVTTSPFPSPPGTDIGALVAQNEQESKKYQAGLAQVRKPFVDEERNILGDMVSRTKRDRDKLEEASNASGVGPHDLPAWNEQEEAAKHTTPPMAQFGSAGMIFAMLASAFTRAPMTNALNGGAAAMKAIQQNDAEGYERAYQAWKSNTDLALKRHAIAREKYQDAMDLMNVDMTLGRARLAAVASELGDVQMQYALETGNDPLSNKLLADRNEQGLRVAEYQQKFEAQQLPIKAYFTLTKAREALQKAQQSGDPAAVEVAKRNVAAAEQGQRDAAMATGHGGYGHALSPDQQILQRIIDEHPDWTGAQVQQEFAKYISSKKPLSSEQEFNARYFQEHPDATAEDYARDHGAFKKQQKELTPDQEVMQRYIADHPDVSGEDLSKWWAGYESSKHKQKEWSLKDQRIQQYMQENNVPYEEAAKHIAEASKPGVGLMSDETAQRMAGQYLEGDKSSVTGLGIGTVGAQNRIKVQEFVTKEAKARGMTPQQIAIVQAEYHGLVTGESALGRRIAQISLAITDAEVLAPVALAASEKVNRTDYPHLNEIIIAGEKHVGNEDVIRLGIATQSLINAYARAINPQGVSTDSDKAHARELLEPYWSKGQYKAGVDQLMIEMRQEQRAPHLVKEEFRRFGTNTPENIGSTGGNWTDIGDGVRIREKP